MRTRPRLSLFGNVEDSQPDIPAAGARSRSVEAKTGRTGDRDVLADRIRLEVISARNELEAARISVVTTARGSEKSA